MALKVTMLFSVTTTAVDPTYAAAHSGGWSESFWAPGSGFRTQAQLDFLLSARRVLLPAGASIIGVRQGLYNLIGKKIFPQGTSGFKIQYPGNPAYTVNLPQDSLELTGQSSSSINANRFRVGCIPDEVMVQGEFAPPAVYKGYLTNYRNELSAGAFPYGFVGRVLSNPTVKVLSITPGVGGVATVVTSAAFGPNPGTDYARFHRVFNDAGKPVKGAFLVQTFVAPATYTISGYTGGVLTEPSGTVRTDQIALYLFGSVTIGRAVSKKIGRPSSTYRGRQSNRT
jgi:hypothetical protein